MNNTSGPQDRAVSRFSEAFASLDFAEIESIIENLDEQIDKVREEKDEEIAVLKDRIAELEAEIDGPQFGKS